MNTDTGRYLTGDGRELNVSEIANLYRNCVNLSTPSSGKIQRLDDQNFSLTCRFSTTDCDNMESISTSKVYSLKTALKSSKEKCIESVRCISEPQTVVESVIVSSNNNRFLAKLKSSTSGDKKQFLEIWDRSRLLKNIDVTEIDAHGLINTDVVFGSMSWYPFGDQDKLIYICNKKRPKYQSFFKQSMPKTDTEKTEDSAPKGKQLNLGDDNIREEDWGECLNGIEHTMIAVLDVGNNCKITTKEVGNFSLGGVKWLNGMKSVSVAYPETPRRLGIIYCNNRSSSLIVHDWLPIEPAETLRLESERLCYHHPCVDNSGQRFVYLANPVHGPHFHSVKIHLYDMNTGQDQELDDESDDAEDLFVTDLLANCFTSDDKNILFVRSDHLCHHLCIFNLSESKIKKIEFPTSGITLLDFKHDVILTSGSEMNATPTLFVAVLNLVNPGDLVAWHQIEDCIHLDELDYELCKIATQDKSSFVSAILVSPNVELLKENFSGELRSTNKAIAQLDLPTLVMVHGGPHSAFSVEYKAVISFYARLGLKVLLVNYRGSTGVSEEYLKSLCGKIGQTDVEDCLHVLRHLTAHKQINPQKLIIYGGSHGGFLACHLSCQQEFKFRSAIIRNPVVDISTLHATSDIPDWSYVEGLGREVHNFAWVPNSGELAQLLECSPMSRFQEAYVPTLMELGRQDRRVPMFQGERWCELLKARGVKVQCKVYNDKHAASKVETMADFNMSAAIWMLENLE